MPDDDQQHSAVPPYLARRTRNGIIEDTHILALDLRNEQDLITLRGVYAKWLSLLSEGLPVEQWLSIGPSPMRHNYAAITVSGAVPRWFISRVRWVLGPSSDRLRSVCCWKMHQKRMERRNAHA